MHNASQPMLDYHCKSTIMRRVLELAKSGLGLVSPNPLVGCVVAIKSQIISEGFHGEVGKQHAEVVALGKLQATDLSDAVLFCNLEPCCHFGKTPPCVTAILDSGIQHVIIAQRDPNPVVCGKGIKLLRMHGITVEVGVLEKEARQLNSDYNYYIKYQKTFIVAKWAMSIDGKLVTNNNNKRISNNKCSVVTHFLRQKLNAILVGVNTVISDNPLLTARYDKCDVISQDPIPIILDSKGRTPLSSNVLDASNKIKTIIATTAAAEHSFIESVKAKGHIVWVMRCNKFGAVDLVALRERMFANNIFSCLVEGGRAVLNSFFACDLVNQVHTFIAPCFIGATSSATNISNLSLEQLDSNYYIRSEGANV